MFNYLSAIQLRRAIFCPVEQKIINYKRKEKIMRRKNNPSLVQELIDGLFDMPQDEFEEKYSTLNRSDMLKVDNASDEAFYNNNYYIDDIPEGCRACGGNYPYCCDSCPMFDD